MYTEKKVIMPGVKLNEFVYLKLTQLSVTEAEDDQVCYVFTWTSLSVAQQTTLQAEFIFSCFLLPLLSKYCSAKHTLLDFS